MTDVGPRYSPYDSGRFQFSLGIKAIEPKDWIEVDGHYEVQLAEKRRLLAERPGEVFDALPDSLDAQAECLDLLLSHLEREHAGLVAIDGSRVRALRTGDEYDRGEFGGRPLDLAGRLVQEDLCLMAPAGDTYALVAASLCFPARWRLADKLGRPMVAIHAPVPGYADKLARPVDRFFARIESGQPYMRLNWSIVDDPTLFQQSGHGRQGVNAAVTAENAGQALWLRIERQTFNRLPETGGLVFGIKTVVDPLAVLAQRPDLAVALGRALADMPESMRDYKSLFPFAGALKGWLERITGG